MLAARPSVGIQASAGRVAFVKVAGRGTSKYPDRYLYEVLQLVRLKRRASGPAWANA